MRHYSVRVISILFIFFISVLFSWAETAPKDKKKYPHPHTLHSETLTGGNADFSVDEVKDWPGFIRSFKERMKVLPLSYEANIVIGGLKPDNLSIDEKKLVVNELNKFLADGRLISQTKNVVKFSADSIKAESDYRNTKEKDDLKWLNRSILNTMFPQIARKGKVRELSKITCTTCHEAYAPVEKELREAAIDERAVMECFSMAIKGERMMDECVEKANMFKRSKIEDYGPLRNFIQRPATNGDIPFFVAVHPEEPYTFKPLLKRLVCIECHGQDRKVTKVKGSDGKMKDIPVFYGLGSDKPKKDQEAESKKNEN